MSKLDIMAKQEVTRQDLAIALAATIFRHHAPKLDAAMEAMKEDLEAQIGPDLGWAGEELGEDTRRAAHMDLRKLVFKVLKMPFPEGRK